MDNAIEKPQSIWQRDIKVDVRGLLKTFAKGGVQSIFGKWDDLSETALEGLDSVGLGRSNEEIAGVLILKSLKRAIRSLLKDNTELILEQNLELDSYKELDIKSFEKALIDGLPEDVWVMNGDFFQRPQNLPMLEPVQLSLAGWLGQYIAEVDANNLSTRLPSYFVYALNEEWKDKADNYQVLLGDETPFDSALKQEQGWQRYRAYLQKKVDEPMFLESFGLRQVYVPLRAYYEQKIETEEEREELAGRGQSEKEKVVVDLETELRQWLTESDKDDAIRLLSGGPGSGKSSFTRMLAAGLSDTWEIPALYVPLHLLGFSGSVKEAITEFIGVDGYLGQNPVDLSDQSLRILIIFDGLDELSMQGTFAAEAARNFIQEIRLLLTQFNQRKLRIQAIISGREVVIQSVGNNFNQSRQLLYLLPYVISEEEKEEEDYLDQQDLLGEDQRQGWWQKYGALKNKDHQGLPKELDRENLFDVTAQPLLNYLISLTIERKKLQFTDETNLNEIYADLLDGVYERSYEQQRNQLIEGIEKFEFVGILEEIALACWHGKGRTTTVTEIENQCSTGGLKNVLETFQATLQEDSKACVTRLLTAFYFRESDDVRDSEKTFEFTHKSFGEYLAAKRILREVEDIYDDLEARKRNYRKGCDERQALTRWAKLCGAAPMDEYIFRFVCDEMKLQKKEQVAAWQQMLCRLFEIMLRDGMPMEELAPRPSFNEEMRQSRNAEESLLAILNSCARVTKKMSEIQWQDSTTFGSWLKRIQGQRKFSKNKLVMECLEHLNLAKCSLLFHDFHGANLSRSNLTYSDLWQCNFITANLQETSFQNASMHAVNFLHAQLENADLSNADLSNANLRSANLKGANLKGANLKGANLKGANLEGADLQNTVLDLSNNPTLD